MDLAARVVVRRRRLSLVFVLIAWFGSPSVAMAGFQTTGPLGQPRSNHTAVLLPTTGQVLVAGGQPQSNNCGTLSSAELYSPALEAWSATGPMNVPRKDFTLTVLPDGRPLAVGGVICGGEVNNTAEIYDPSLATWTFTGNASFHHSGHAAVLLTTGTNAGKVLVLAGDDGFGNAVNTAELYDPASDSWTTTGSLVGARMFPQAVELLDGRVLAAGGQLPNVFNLDSAELYDPGSGAWAPAANMTKMRDGNHRANLLLSGKVLVSGGNSFDGVNPGTVLSSAELYDPATSSWTSAGDMVQPRAAHGAERLPNGEVLVAGGVNLSTWLRSGEIYDPTDGSWSPTNDLSEARSHGTATRLQTGGVFAAGLTAASGYTTTADLCAPASPQPFTLYLHGTGPLANPPTLFLDGTPPTPRMFAGEGEVYGGGSPPVATEWTVEARAGGVCLIRMVHSLFASTDEWDNQLEGAESGWSGFLAWFQERFPMPTELSKSE